MKNFTILCAAALAGCTPAAPASDGHDRTVWTDPDTGCNYIVVDKGLGQNRVYGITIRFNADGTADCPGKVGAS